MSALSPELLKILCCPETHQEIAPADPSVVASVNQKIAAGTLRNRAGETLSQPIEAGLLRSDRKYLYPVRHGIPIMLIGEAIALLEFDKAGTDRRG